MRLSGWLALLALLGLALAPAAGPARAADSDELRKGFTCLRMGDYACGRRHLNKAISGVGLTERQRMIALVMRGDLNNDERQFDAALADYDAALAISRRIAQASEQGSILSARGRAHSRMGNYEKALADLGQAIALSPADSMALYRRGNVYKSMGNLDQALADYTLAIQLSPHHRYYYRRSQIYEAKEDLRAAMEDMRQAMLLRSDRKDYRARFHYLESKIER